jgi:hypothetical protein
LFITAGLIVGIYLSTTKIILPTIFAADSPWTDTDWSTSGDYSSKSNIDNTNEGYFTVEETEGWDLESWLYRREIDFDELLDEGYEEETDFPVPVKLENGVNIDYSKIKDDGSDIRFVDSEGNLLSYEIDIWDNNGDSFLWVVIPLIQSGDPTYIYMYYGNESAEDPGYGADIKESPCSGGDINTGGIYYFHEFYSDSTFSCTNNVDIDVLVVAGGGGGGYRHGGGGGGGGVIVENDYSVTADEDITVTVGEGGLGATGGSTQAAEVEKEIIQLGDKAEMQALINRSMLQILSLEPEEAIGSNFKLKFVVVGNLVPEKAGMKLETEFQEYKIAGIIPGQQNPVVWVPFIDLRGLGVERYSQAKLVVNNERDLPDARKQVEAMGYKTSSVADTVAKINSLFSTVRILLLSLGMIALVVAALGMFNTLTVSLLERTREVGVMKAMGVKSNEVKDLFLTESMIMGVLGGVLGIIFGWVAGKGLSFFLTLFAVFKGAGPMDISFIPMFFIFIIIFLSLLVGFITGFYPARRATNISALNALRYE